MPEAHTNYLSSDLYVTFWELELSDIFEFDESYSRALTKCESKLESFQQLESAKKDKTCELEGVSQARGSLQMLKEERLSKATEVRNVKSKLKRDCQAWIKSEDRATVALCFLQHMILPRLKFSIIDAYYAAHFIDYCMNSRFHCSICYSSTTGFSATSLNSYIRAANAKAHSLVCSCRAF